MFPWLDRKIYFQATYKFGHLYRVCLDQVNYSIIKALISGVDKFSGDFVERVTPVPIPNTEVKPLSPDGTARASAWESRSSPN